MEGAGDQNLPSNRQIKCDVCNVWCSGIVSYQTHITGKPHYVALQKQKGVEFKPTHGNGTDGGPPSKRARKSAGAPPEEILCNICNISLTGKESYDAHLKGARHLKKVKENELAPDADSLPHIVEVPGKGYRCAVCKVDMTGKVVVLSHVKGAKHLKRLNNPVPPTPDGAEPPRKELPFECKVCHIFTNTEAIMKVHQASAKHKHKVDLAAKIAAEVGAKEAAQEEARREAKIGQQYDAWDPQG